MRLFKFATIYYKLCLAVNITFSEALNILGLTQDFTAEALSKAYRQKAFSLHPDRNKAPTAESDFIKAGQAYELLKNWLENKGMSPPEEDAFDMENPPWRHEYWTPREEYTEAERWEYYTNPEIHQQYQREFEHEQEYGREEYERSEEQKWEADHERSRDNVHSITEALEGNGIVPEQAISAFGLPLEEQLVILKLNKDDIDIKRWTESNWLKNELNAAIYKYIVDNHVNLLPTLIRSSNFKTIYKAIEGYVKYNRASEVLDLNAFISLMKEGYFNFYDLRARSDEDKIKVYKAMPDVILKMLDETIKGRGSAVNFFAWVPKEAIQELLNYVKEANPEATTMFPGDSFRRDEEVSLVSVIENHLKRAK